MEIVTIFHFLPSSLSSFFFSEHSVESENINRRRRRRRREGTENAYQNGVSFKPPAQTHISRPFFGPQFPPKTQTDLRPNQGRRHQQLTMDCLTTLATSEPPWPKKGEREGSPFPEKEKVARRRFSPLCVCGRIKAVDLLPGLKRRERVCAFSLPPGLKGGQ